MKIEKNYEKPEIEVEKAFTEDVLLSSLNSGEWDPQPSGQQEQPNTNL